MSLRIVARTIAVLIAVLGTIDPVTSLERPVRRPVVIAADGTTAGALESAMRLSDLLGDAYDVHLRRVDAVDRRSACATGESCVLVGPTDWAPVAEGEIAAAVRIDRPSDARVTLTRVDAPTMTSASAVGQLVVQLTGRGLTGQTSTVDIFDHDVPVGRGEHRWTEDGHVSVPVQWWPVGEGLRPLSVRVSRPGTPGTGEDARADVGVAVGAEPLNVLVYDTRPSWTSTFIRRVLERDQRVALRVVAKLGPRLETTVGAPFRLDEKTLDEASAVLVGAPDSLSARDVDALERFVRVRGGSLILAPDTRPTGPITRLLPGRTTERLEPSPLQIGEWRASELLISHDLRPGDVTLAKAGNDAIAVARPTGAGRLVLVGAMDAWRYRDADDDAFDRAWQSLVADAVAAGGRSIEVAADRAVVQPAEEVTVDVRLRAMAAVDAATEVSATIACGDASVRPLRLWPTGDRRRFTGRFSPERAGACRIAVSSTAPIAATARTEILAAPDFHSVAKIFEGSDPEGALAQLAAIGGVPLRSAGDETTVSGDVRQRVAGERAPLPVRPMRSPWWIVPFAACLGVEWWLRRRRGLR